MKERLNWVSYVAKKKALKRCGVEGSSWELFAFFSTVQVLSAPVVGGLSVPFFFVHQMMLAISSLPFRVFYDRAAEFNLHTNMQTHKHFFILRRETRTLVRKKQKAARMN
jgi:hypothetical protein